MRKWNPIIKDTDGAIYDVIKQSTTKLFGRGIEERDNPIKLIKNINYTLATGGMGIALTAGYLDAAYPKNNWDYVAHEYMKFYSKIISKQYIGVSLFSGLVGVAFTTSILSGEKEGRYIKFIKKVDRYIFRELDEISKRISLKTREVSGDYFDLVSGVIGISAYLLYHNKEKQLSRLLRPIIRRILIDKNLSYFYFVKSQRGKKEIDFGMAHGMAGVLSVLSLSSINFIEEEGLKESIEQIAEWFIDNRIDDGYGVNWPYKMGASISSTASRSAWCYGNPGIAVAMQMAGIATKKRKYRDIAKETMIAAYNKPVKITKINSSTFCHGISGVLQSSLRLYRLTNQEMYKQQSRCMINEILAKYDEKARFGYRDFDLEYRDNPGILNGTSGIILSLVAATSKVDPLWDRMFLLS